jgi:serine O-acetyltransferase
MNKALKLDIDAAMRNDPAARTRFEVRHTYSGIKALIMHRRANFFLPPRLETFGKVYLAKGKA